MARPTLARVSLASIALGLLLGALLWYSPPAQTSPNTQSTIPPDTDGEVPVESKCEPEGNPEWGEDWLAMYQWKTIRDDSDNVKEIYGKVYLNLCRMDDMGLTRKEKLAALSHEMAHSRGWRHYEGTPEENAAYYPNALRTIGY